MRTHLTSLLLHYSFYVRLTLGGGYGHLSGKHGLTVDNLVQVCSTRRTETSFTHSNTANRRHSSRLPVKLSLHPSLPTPTCSMPSVAVEVTLGLSPNSYSQPTPHNHLKPHLTQTYLHSKLHPQRKTVFGGVIAFIPPQLDAILSTFASRVKDSRPRESIHMAFGLSPDKVSRFPRPSVSYSEISSRNLAFS